MQNAIANRNNTGFPVTVYDVYPKFEGYSGTAVVYDNSYYRPRLEPRHTSGSMYPYNGDHWRETAARLRVVVPFQTVISRDMGTSKCLDCGQHYAGSAPEGCQRVVRKVNVSQSDYGETWKVTEQYTRHEKTGRVKIEQCGSRVEWSLQREFEFQSAFFSLLSDLQGVYLEDRLEVYRSAFPTDLIPVIRDKMLEQRMSAFEGRCMNAFQQISSKMSQAGQALQF